ncbi:MAG: hypothetical protein Q9162_004097 [Coniocarpon cinnabarinum]
MFTGIAVSNSGRMFSCFPAGLDPTNTFQGIGETFQVAELTGQSSETPYPNLTYNQSPLGAVNRLTVPPTTKGDPNHLLGVQSVVIDELDVLWILDTGRVIDFEDPLHPMLDSAPGGPKLVQVDLESNQVVQTILLGDAAYPTSYPNDVRIDRSPDLSGINGGQGAAYISDSSVEGRNGIIICDIGKANCWRHLDASSTVHSVNGTVPFVYGDPMYQITGVMVPTYITFGVDGIAMSPDGGLLYYSVIGGRFLYSVPTQLLRAQGGESDAQAVAAIKNLGEKGISDGLETDSNGIVYAGNAEQDAVSMYNPLTTFATVFKRDPRINWVDTMSIATDGNLYFTVNQLNYLFAIYPGQGVPAIDRRERPFVLFRTKLPNGGTKIRPGGLLS